MRANDYIKKLPLLPHEENGQYMLTRYAHTSMARSSSGSCLYYLGETEWSKFHIIDCDEYWVYTLGSDLELWIIYPDNTFEKKLLGTGDGASVMQFVPKGSLFGSRHAAGAEDGTLIGLVTVPGFVEENSCRLYSQDEVTALYPFLKAFWE